MAIKIDFMKKEAPEAGLEEHNTDEKSKMQECISMIESGEGEKAIPILQSLIAGEDEETNEEPKQNFRDEIAKKI